MDRGAWWATAHGVTKSQTQLSDLACTHGEYVNMMDPCSLFKDFCGVPADSPLYIYPASFGWHALQWTHGIGLPSEAVQN